MGEVLEIEQKNTPLGERPILHERALRRKRKTKAARGGYATDGEILQEIKRMNTTNRRVNSSFFLSVSHVPNLGWECVCGFNNIFSNVPCAKCGLQKS
jgi:hypothetical protein